MTLHDIIKENIHDILVQEGYSELQKNQVVVQNTKADFDGDFTLVTFGLSRVLKSTPDVAAEKIGALLLEKNPEFYQKYNVIKGFLNLSIQNQVLIDWLGNQQKAGLTLARNNGMIMVEYSSPNTNKPLHFGHMRNIFLGDAMSRIIAANGYDVIKANLINDRGIHICKSMLAWQNWGDGATPESTGTKGDHFVGEYYVLFETKLNEQLEDVYPQALEGTYHFALESMQTDFDTIKNKLQNSTDTDEKVKLEKELKSLLKKDLPLIRDAREMLRKWEAGDNATVALWSQMNAWVYQGFDVTYERMGIHFDKVYHESETYKLGKDMVLNALKEDQLLQKEDGSIWVDLTGEGLDEKILLRSDGTTVYMTQDLGTAQLKFDDYPLQESIYVIGDEQNYHMQVLKLTYAKMNASNADKIYHLSYGMVELPDGKMKSREGNVVDADEMLDEMKRIAKERTLEAGKTVEISDDEADVLYENIGKGALKFFLLRVNPKKKMLFNPQESIDLQGYTATAIQYTYARICSIFRKMAINLESMELKDDSVLTEDLERQQIFKISEYLNHLEQAQSEYDPSLICNYLYDLSKGFNSFYDKCSITKAESKEQQNMRLGIAKWTAITIKEGMALLGIEVPERM